MTQTLKKPNIETQDMGEYYANYFKDKNTHRSYILDYLFRTFTFVNRGEKIRVITNGEYEQISRDLNVPLVLIHKVISRFLVDLIRIKMFFRHNTLLLRNRNQGVKVRIYLHKLHRLAPVFDYNRARENVKRLQMKLDQLCFRPQIMTQVAIVLFITDLLDDHPFRTDSKIIQSNLRVLCNCSAYAFHRTRNKLGLHLHSPKD
jgi:hypothetical protein